MAARLNATLGLAAAIHSSRRWVTMVDNAHVKSVSFVKSAVYPKDYPETTLPEIAVAGRSNGANRLSLIAANRRRLAKVSIHPDGHSC